MRLPPVLVVALLLGACAGSPPPVQRLDSYFPGDPGLVWKSIGRSVEGRTIYSVEFGHGKDITLIFGGFHGNEQTSIHVTFELCLELAKMRTLLAGRRVVVVPILNPDGFVKDRRNNARDVDLNRNLPTKNWADGTLRRDDHPGASAASEPETRVAMELVKRLRPDKILSLHSPLRVNNYDGDQSRPLAQVMATFNRYPVKGYIGYPTPGSFGTWAGIERNIPTVTLEIPNGRRFQRWDENRWALLAAIRFDPKS